MIDFLAGAIRQLPSTLVILGTAWLTLHLLGYRITRKGRHER